MRLVRIRSVSPRPIEALTMSITFHGKIETIVENGDNYWAMQHPT